MFDLAASVAQIPRLSVRQRQTAYLLSEGLSNEEIATRMGIGQQTVKHHLVAVFATLQVTSRTQVVIVMLRQGSV